MNETVVTIVGNLTADPDVRFTQAGRAVANLTVASTPRQFDKATGRWEDQEALFQRCQVWGQYAEHVAETLGRGMRVVVTGRLRARKWQDRDGNNRTAVDLVVDEIGPSLRYATAAVRKATRSGPAPAADDDPWTRPASAADDAPF